MIAYSLYCCFCWMAWFAIPTPLRAVEPDLVRPEPFMIGDVIYFQARGNYLPTLEEARESALEKARDRLATILRSHGIQRFMLPSLDWIERQLVLKEYTRQNRETIEDQELENKELVQLTYQLQLTPTHMRAFRKMERTSLSAIAVGLLAVAFLASWLYYRLDEWSKGYLTSWLAIGLVVAGSIVGGIWWWLHS